MYLLIFSFLKGSMDKFRLIFINPFKKLQPTEYELMYMMMSIMWSVSSKLLSFWNQYYSLTADLPGITDATRDISEKVELRLAEDLHTYYAEQYDNNNPNYAGRITRLSSIASAVDVSFFFISSVWFRNYLDNIYNVYIFSGDHWTKKGG